MEGTTILGSFPQLPPFKAGEQQLDKGAIVLAFTDGLTDVQNKEGAFYSEEKISQLLLRAQYQDMHALNQALVRDVRAHQGEESFTDDTSILSFCAH
jgi:serine phosphatase RsbU (regulator of sigma subunit)